MKDPRSKIQDPKKLQAPSSNRLRFSGSARCLEFEVWCLSGAWSLELLLEFHSISHTIGSKANDVMISREVVALKKDPRSKIQDPEKLQAPSSNRLGFSGSARCLEFEVWCLSGAWSLELGSSFLIA
jgi:hypothetical protein